MVGVLGGENEDKILLYRNQKGEAFCFAINSYIYNFNQSKALLYIVSNTFSL